MRSILIRFYPAPWRARYGDEFASILEERPLGPFDVADILIGALDAQLRLRGHGFRAKGARRFIMSLRIGGIAAIIGAPLWSGGFMLGSGAIGDVERSTAGLLLLGGSLAILVALAGLSAFQARVQPALSWFAFALPAIGTVALTVGALDAALGHADFTDAFFFGLVTFFLGSLLFAIATFVTGVLSRPAAVVLGIAPVLAVASGGSEGPGAVLNLAALICFALGWFALGVQAIRLDGPANAPRPA